jgi:acetoin utilization deacetylase AcuC-like enzyme
LTATPVFFHSDQLEFKPKYEWAFGERIDHPETTARAESILTALAAEPEAFCVRPPTTMSRTALRKIHAYELLTLYNTAKALEGDFYPTVFPKRKQGRGDPTNIRQAGAWCFDAGTPLNAQTWSAAAWSAACARDAAAAVVHGAPLAYALSRPPGHHATRDLFGGYCYFNNAAIAADRFRTRGRVAILDIDFHHGNGTQSIFYRDPRVLVINVHGDPTTYFPYFAGYSHETGAGRGLGFNLNLPLPKGCDGQEWLAVFDRHIQPALVNFGPSALVLSAGLDAYHLDPIGEFTLDTADFYAIGDRLGRLPWPTIVVQEGGYYTPDLGKNAAALMHGLRDGQRSRAQVS